MLIRHNKEFIKGLLLAVTFLIILIIMFTDNFGGENAFKAADRLFNSISKGSTYYIGDLLKKTQPFNETSFEAGLKFKDQDSSEKAIKLLSSAGAKTFVEGAQVKVTGNLGQILTSTLKDSDAMFYNRDSDLVSRYGFPGPAVMKTWHSVLKELDKDLKKQSKFKEAAFVGDVIKKGVEVSYNYFKIQPEDARSKIGILSFALVFYVIYTLWWGIAIFFLFEGIGLQMTAGAKKEM
jgi:hypothetical protein